MIAPAIFLITASYLFHLPMVNSTDLLQTNIPIVKNLMKPLRGSLTLDLKEELSIGNENNEQTAFYLNVTFTVDGAGNYYILDMGNKRVQKFDRDGKDLLTIGRQGQGPGEFQNPGAVFMGKSGDLFVRDQGIRLSRFKKDGEFVEEIRFPQSVSSLVPVGNDRFVGSASQVEDNIILYRIELFGPQGNKIKTLAKIEYRHPYSFVGSQVVGARNSFRPYPSCLRNTIQ
jgi:hypothetical protein